MAQITNAFRSPLNSGENASTLNENKPRETPPPQPTTTSPPPPPPPLADESRSYLSNLVVAAPPPTPTPAPETTNVQADQRG